MADDLTDTPNAGVGERDPRQDAGQDPTIQARLERDPENKQAQLDSALDETMDGSDPVGIIQPAADEPPMSSGYDPEAEEKLRSQG